MKHPPPPLPLKDTGALEVNELPLRTAFLVIFLCTLFGANAVAIKISLMEMGVFTTAGLRFSLAAIVLFLWARWRDIPLAVTKSQRLPVLTISLVFFVQMSGMYFGQNLTTASHGTLIANFLPFVVMILAHFFLLNDTVSFKKATGLLLGFCGVALLLFDTQPSAENTLQGDCVILGAVLLWGGNVILIKRIIAGFHPVQITIYPMLISAPLFFAAAIFSGEPVFAYISPYAVTALLYQSLVTASFGFIMWNTLIQKYGVTGLHSFIFIVPISGVFFGVLLLKEPLTSNLIGSILFVTAGLFVVNFKRRRVTAVRTLL